MVDRKVAIGAALAVGAVLLLPGVAAAAARAGRPLGKAALRTGATAYEEFRRAGAEVLEHLEDLVAEVKAEMQDGTAGEHDANLAEEVEVLAKKARATRKA